VDATLPLRWALDFNVDPMCSVIAQVRDGVVHVLDEMVMRRVSTREVCEDFLNRYGRHPAGVVVYGDASGSRRQTTGSSDFGMMREALSKGNIKCRGYRVPRANPEVRERVNVVNAMLQSAQNESRLFIHPRCRELVLDLEQVCYKPGTTFIDKDRDPRRTHLSDALGYLVWQECRPMGRAGERGERLLG
jgi:hypothetical protein